MDISELPIEIQELAHRRQIEQGNDGTFDGDLAEGKSTQNFNWDQTPEESFWDQLYSGGVEEVKNHPSYPNKEQYEIY